MENEFKDIVGTLDENKLKLLEDCNQKVCQMLLITMRVIGAENYIYAKCISGEDVYELSFKKVVKPN